MRCTNEQGAGYNSRVPLMLLFPSSRMSIGNINRDVCSIVSSSPSPIYIYINAWNEWSIKTKRTKHEGFEPKNLLVFHPLSFLFTSKFWVSSSTKKSTTWSCRRRIGFNGTALRKLGTWSLGGVGILRIQEAKPWWSGPSASLGLLVGTEIRVSICLCEFAIDVWSMVWMAIYAFSFVLSIRFVDRCLVDLSVLF